MPKNTRDLLPKLLSEIKKTVETTLEEGELKDEAEQDRLRRLLSFCNTGTMTIAGKPSLLSTIAADAAGIAINDQTLLIAVLLKEAAEITDPEASFFSISAFEEFFVSKSAIEKAATEAHEALAMSLLPRLKDFMDNYQEKFAERESQLRKELDSLLLEANEDTAAIEKASSAVNDPAQEIQLPAIKELFQTKGESIRQRELRFQALDKQVKTLITHISAYEKYYGRQVGVPNLKIEMDSLQDQIFTQKSRLRVLETNPTKTPHAKNKLYIAIKKMKEYGELLQEVDKEKGEVAVALAECLTLKANAYFYRDQKNKTEVAYRTFKEEFTEMLHSKDQTMSTHRAAWRPIVANVLIALATCFLAHIARGIYTLAATDQYSFFFFEKTKRQELQTEIENRLQPKNERGSPSARRT